MRYPFHTEGEGTAAVRGCLWGLLFAAAFLVLLALTIYAIVRYYA
jgi:hypothetical protein